MVSGEIRYAVPRNGEISNFLIVNWLCHAVYLVFRCRICNLDGVQGISAGLDRPVGLCSFEWLQWHCILHLAEGWRRSR